MEGARAIIAVKPPFLLRAQLSSWPNLLEAFALQACTNLAINIAAGRRVFCSCQVSLLR